MSELHVIFGTGPAGCWTAHALREKGLSVRAVNRSGKRPGLMPPDVEIVAADASVPQQAIKAAEGAAAVYQALNPEYHEWETYFPGLQAGALEAAKHTGTRFISIENLYMYDSSRPINEDSPIRPRSKKGELRARMADEVMEAHARGEVQAAALRSSDYYGPGVLGSALGEMVFGSLVKGEKARVSGSAEMPHSFAYIQDVGKAASVLGTSELALGKVWIVPHAPPITQRKFVEMACQQIGVDPQVSVISPFMMRMAGLFIPGARASVEMLYEFTEPFEVVSSRFEETFGLHSTPIAAGIAETINWYQKQHYLH
jgi:nucleoside-diphosphate-sugar epimerase